MATVDERKKILPAFKPLDRTKTGKQVFKAQLGAELRKPAKPPTRQQKLSREFEHPTLSLPTRPAPTPAQQPATAQAPPERAGVSPAPAPQGITGEGGRFVGTRVGGTGPDLTPEQRRQHGEDLQARQLAGIRAFEDLRGARANIEGRGTGLFGNRSFDTGRQERFATRQAAQQAEAAKGQATRGIALRKEQRDIEQTGFERGTEARESVAQARTDLAGAEGTATRDAIYSNALSGFDRSAFGENPTDRQQEQKQFLAEELSKLDREQSILGKLMGDSLGIDPSKELTATDLDKLAVNPRFIDELENILTGGEVDVSEVPTPLLTAIRQGGGGRSPETQRQRLGIATQ